MKPNGTAAKPHNCLSFCPWETIDLLGKVETTGDQAITLIFMSSTCWLWAAEFCAEYNKKTEFVKYMCIGSLDND